MPFFLKLRGSHLSHHHFVPHFAYSLCKVLSKGPLCTRVCYTVLPHVGLFELELVIHFSSSHTLGVAASCKCMLLHTHISIFLPACYAEGKRSSICYNQAEKQSTIGVGATLIRVITPNSYKRESHMCPSTATPMTTRLRASGRKRLVELLALQQRSTLCVCFYSNNMHKEVTLHT